MSNIIYINLINLSLTHQIYQFQQDIQNPILHPFRLAYTVQRCSMQKNELTLIGHWHDSLPSTNM